VSRLARIAAGLQTALVALALATCNLPQPNLPHF
jgi:hypothetical protein